jgi:hypothetical protein
MGHHLTWAARRAEGGFVQRRTIVWGSIIALAGAAAGCSSKSAGNDGSPPSGGNDGSPSGGNDGATGSGNDGGAVMGACGAIQASCDGRTTRYACYELSNFAPAQLPADMNACTPILGTWHMGTGCTRCAQAVSCNKVIAGNNSACTTSWWYPVPGIGGSAGSPDPNGTHQSDCTSNGGTWTPASNTGIDCRFVNLDPACMPLLTCCDSLADPGQKQACQASLAQDDPPTCRLTLQQFMSMGECGGTVDAGVVMDAAPQGGLDAQGGMDAVQFGFDAQGGMTGSDAQAGMDVSTSTASDGGPVTCATLAACCPTITNSAPLQMACNSIVQTANDPACAQTYSQLQMNGYCH